MRWIFKSKNLNSNMFDASMLYARHGYIINGMSFPSEKTIFINMAVIKTFKTLYRTIAEEVLHVVANIKGSRPEEDVIKKMLDWVW